MNRKEEIAQLKARIAELEAMGKWTPQPGEVCEVWDSDERPAFPSLQRFHSFGKDGKFFDCNIDGDIDVSWKHFAPFSLPGVPWEGGERPVDEGQRVAYELRKGTIFGNLGGRSRWDHKNGPTDIVKYWRLAP